MTRNETIKALNCEMRQNMAEWEDWYPSVFKDLETTDPKELLTRLEPYGDREGALFSQGYIEGLREAKRIVKR